MPRSPTEPALMAITFRMTSLEEGFFHALQQDPDDDTNRLVYADFLEDRGNPASLARAELIRVQVELAALAPNTPSLAERGAELTARQNQLLHDWERIWLGEWAFVLDDWVFRRGFLEAVRADASVFLDHAEQWFAKWPTLSVAKLTRAAGHLSELAESPWLAYLRGLDLSDNFIDSASLSALTSSRYVCLLQALDLSGNLIGVRGAELLATACTAHELRELHLARCGIAGRGLEEFVSLCTRPLRRLDLSNNGLTRPDLVRLIDSSLMRNLEALDLASNPFGDNGASVLAESPNARGLVHLGLCDTMSGDETVTALATSRNLRGLRSLDLRGHSCRWFSDDQNEERDGGVALAGSPLLGQLDRLLFGPNGTSNNWTAEVLKLLRRPRRPDIVPSNNKMVSQLRKSRYLVPSRLIECDNEELWWLGDTHRRQRLPSVWDEEE